MNTNSISSLTGIKLQWKNTLCQFLFLIIGYGFLVCLAFQFSMFFAEMQALAAYLKGTDIETAMLSNCISCDIKEG